MPVDYRIEDSRRLVITSAQGRVTFAEIEAQRDRMLSDPHLDPSFDQLIDAIAVTHLDITGEQGRVLGSRSVFSSASKRAFVAKDPHVFGLGRLITTNQTLIEGGSEVNVFSNLDLALEWLALKQST